ncbi:hypothetical protein ACWCPT_29460 [Streptomyces sp. NPDC002308]
MTDDIRDQHIADLRTVIERAIPWLAFSVGAETRSLPEHSEGMLAAAAEMKAVLERTAPA